MTKSFSSYLAVSLLASATLAADFMLNDPSDARMEDRPPAACFSYEGQVCPTFRMSNGTYWREVGGENLSPKSAAFLLLRKVRGNGVAEFFDQRSGESGLLELFDWAEGAGSPIHLLNLSDPLVIRVDSEDWIIPKAERSTFIGWVPNGRLVFFPLEEEGPERLCMNLFTGEFVILVPYSSLARRGGV